MNCRAKELLEALDITAIDPKDKVQFLSVAQKQLLEMAKAFSNNSKLIILDEPTSALTEEECQHLFRIVNQMKAQGTSFIYITHKMDEVFVIADEVTVMRDGQYVDTKQSSQVSKNAPGEDDGGPGPIQCLSQAGGGQGGRVAGGFKPDVSRSDPGRKLHGPPGGDPRRSRADGGGRSETMETLFGLRHKSSGTVRIDGKEVSIRKPQEPSTTRLPF